MLAKYPRFHPLKPIKNHKRWGKGDNSSLNFDGADIYFCHSRQTTDKPERVVLASVKAVHTGRPRHRSTDIVPRSMSKYSIAGKWDHSLVLVSRALHMRQEQKRSVSQMIPLDRVTPLKVVIRDVSRWSLMRTSIFIVIF